MSICARGAEALAAVRDEIAAHGVTAHAEVCDIADAAAVAAYIGAAAEALGGIDILVNNASGFGSSNDEAGWARSIDVDLLGTVRATWAAVPFLTASRTGAIINISSISGIGASARTTYGAVKAALISTRRARPRLARQGIRPSAWRRARSNSGGTWGGQDQQPAALRRIRAVSRSAVSAGRRSGASRAFLASPWPTGSLGRRSRSMAASHCDEVSVRCLEGGFAPALEDDVEGRAAGYRRLAAGRGCDAPNRPRSTTTAGRSRSPPRRRNNPHRDVRNRAQRAMLMRGACSALPRPGPAGFGHHAKPLGVGHTRPKPRKCGSSGFSSCRSGMVVAPGGIGLPQLDEGVRHRRAVAVDDPPLDRDALSCRVVGADVGPLRALQPEMKERPDGLRRGGDQLVGHRLARALGPSYTGSAGVASRPRRTMSKR